MTAGFPLGAHPGQDGTTTFCVWAPSTERVQLRIEGEATRSIDMQPAGNGYYTLITETDPAADYRFDLGAGNVLPDPASRHQPHGVHGPSRVLQRSHEWQVDSWLQPDLGDGVIYELHVGTFTDEGTFDAAIGRLPPLRELGVTMLELMPVAQFPGSRNWGYDGVYPFAAQQSYGGPAGLKRFVDAAHALDLNVALDVVYNHLGPEGNYLNCYGPYFTDTYRTPWGSALNFDGPDSDEVRRFFIESALQWIDEFRIDALRLDAVHSIFDSTADPFLRQLTAAVHQRAASLQRRVIVIAESDLGDPRVLRPASHGGFNVDAQWLDDFHHALRALLTGETDGYYIDFGQIDHFARSLQHGYVYAGHYSRFRRRRHGASAPDIRPQQFVVYGQNHDQVGNRMIGDRLSTVLDPAQLRLLAAAVLLSPFTPMLFMGEEYGETRPFPYFVCHSDDDLIAAVRLGRREEFAAFAWHAEPPDPQDEQTFRDAVLDWSARERPGHRELLALYQHLLALRARVPAMRANGARTVEVLDRSGRPSDGLARDGVVVLRRDAGTQRSALFLNFCPEPVRVTVPRDGGPWHLALDTSLPEWGGAGPNVTDQVENEVLQDIQLNAHTAILLLNVETLTA